MSKLKLEKVIEIFKDFASEQDVSDNPYLCYSAISSIESMIRENCDVQAHMDELCYAAACELYYRYVLKTSPEETPGFKAGDVSVESTAEITIENAKKLLDKALSDISYLVKPRHFAFRKL